MWTSDVGESESRRLLQNPRHSASKECKILSLHRCRKTFFSVFSIASSVQENFCSVFSIASSVKEIFFLFFLSLHLSRKTFFGFYYRFIGAGKLFSVFSIASSVQEKFFLAFSIASLVKKNFLNKIVLLYSIFFSKIVFRYRFNRYIFEYRCPSLGVSISFLVDDAILFSAIGILVVNSKQRV